MKFRMATIKVDNCLRPFRGKATESWDQFWAKYLVMAEIQGWDDEPKRMKNFPHADAAYDSVGW